MRIDPTTLLVDISDQTFATSTGSIRDGPSSMPYAVAMDCAGYRTTAGVGNIHLTGTPFVVAPDVFVAAGWDYATRSAASLNGGRIVGLRDGGECGWLMAGPSINSPVGAVGMFQLQLAGRRSGAGHPGSSARTA